jgi:signal transduction histidine kinase
MVRLRGAGEASDIGKATVEALYLRYRADLVLVRPPGTEEWSGNALPDEVAHILTAYEGNSTSLHAFLERVRTKPTAFSPLVQRRRLRLPFRSLGGLVFVATASVSGASVATFFKRPLLSSDQDNIASDLRSAAQLLAGEAPPPKEALDEVLPLLKPLDIQKEEATPRRFLEAVLYALKRYLVDLAGDQKAPLWFLERRSPPDSDSPEFGYFFTRDDLRIAEELFGRDRDSFDTLLSSESHYSLSKGTGLSPYVSLMGCLHVALDWREDPRIRRDDYPKVLRRWEEYALTGRHLLQVPSRRQEIPFILMWTFDGDWPDLDLVHRLTSAFRRGAPLLHLASEAEEIHEKLAEERAHSQALNDVSALSSFLVHNASKAFINPLSIIKFDLRSILGAVNDKGKGVIAKVLRDIDRVASALQQTLSYIDRVRQPGRTRTLEVEEVDLCHALVDFALPLVRDRLVELDEYFSTDLFQKTVRIEQPCASGHSWKLMGSQVFTGQSLWVLLQNAVEALEAKTLERDPDRGIIAVLLVEVEREERGFVVVEVQDRGKGIEASLLTRLRTLIGGAESGKMHDVPSEERLSTKGGEHLGLGVLSVARYVASLGGWTEIESKEGAGTVVRLFFPKVTGRGFIV